VIFGSFSNSYHVKIHIFRAIWIHKLFNLDYIDFSHTLALQPLRCTTEGKGMRFSGGEWKEKRNKLYGAELVSWERVKERSESPLGESVRVECFENKYKERK